MRLIAEDDFVTAAARIFIILYILRLPPRAIGFLATVSQHGGATIYFDGLLLSFLDRRRFLGLYQFPLSPPLVNTQPGHDAKLDYFSRAVTPRACSPPYLYDATPHHQKQTLFDDSADGY